MKKLLTMLFVTMFICGCVRRCASKHSRPIREKNTSESIVLPKKDGVAAEEKSDSKTSVAAKNSAVLDRNQEAIDLVGQALSRNNKLNVTRNELLSKMNPKGEGVFVYVQKTRYQGVMRHLIWMVIDSQAYALNGPSKMVTPSLAWPREADETMWNKTRIDKFSAQEAIRAVFEDE